MEKINMVDLGKQYQPIQQEIDTAILDCVRSCAFINGPTVKSFQQHLERYLDVAHVIPCANGTDALQIALMALGLKAGDEVIVPTFTYVASAEVIGLLGLVPVMVDVDEQSFNVTADHIKAAITAKTKAIMPVHLFGQTADMEGIMQLAKQHNLFVVEDNAQAIGADYTFSDGRKQKAGTIGDIGCTSFYPSKNLGAYGDGGAIFTNDDILAAKLRKIANHGQNRRYYHDCIGVNSRLDSIQAAILDVKLKYLDDYIHSRQAAAAYYDAAFVGIDAIQTPYRMHNSTHVFHQYTLKVPAEKRDALQDYLKEHWIPSMIYYPLPLYEQDAFKGITRKGADNFAATDKLCASVISLPMHTELDEEQLHFITTKVKAFFT